MTLIGSVFERRKLMSYYLSMCLSVCAYKMTTSSLDHRGTGGTGRHHQAWIEPRDSPMLGKHSAN